MPESTNPVASKAAEELKHWAVSLNEYCSDLSRNSLTVTEWQDRLTELFNKIELKELLNVIDFEKLSSGFEFPDRGVSTRNVRFPEIEGLPKNTVFVSKIFGMKRGRAIIPHGHSNMSSGHLILNGKFYLRQYDKIENTSARMKIRPTVERRISVGDFSSISDERNNVHWFVAETDSAFAFDVIMLDLGGKKYDIHNLDIDSSEALADGNLNVPIIGVNEALAKYGKGKGAESNYE